VSILIRVVDLRRRPLQVAEAVIPTIPVEVAALHAGRTRPDEGFEDQSMDETAGAAGHPRLDTTRAEPRIAMEGLRRHPPPFVAHDDRISDAIPKEHSFQTRPHAPIVPEPIARESLNLPILYGRGRIASRHGSLLARATVFRMAGGITSPTAIRHFTIFA
jgi:hypothetical protein